MGAIFFFFLQLNCVRGGIGVEFFFITSGCMMAKSYEKRNITESIGISTKNFITRKIKLLLPNIYLAWIMAFILYNYNVTIKEVIVSFISSIWELTFIWMAKFSGTVSNSTTWYISSMLLVMLVVYPVMCKYKDSFFFVITPVGFIFIMGYLSNMYGGRLTNLTGEGDGFFYNGILRAMAEILGGCICYKCAIAIRQYKYLKGIRVIFTILEVCIYGVIIIGQQILSWDYLEIIYLIMLMIAVSITMSQISYCDTVLNTRFCGWLGEFSLSLYLAHYPWTQFLLKIFPIEMNYYKCMMVYICISIIAGLFIMYTSKILKVFWKRIRVSWVDYIGV